MLTIQERIQQLPELRLRASAGGELAAGISCLTPTQAKDLKELLERPKPTEKQLETIAGYIYKRDHPELSEGCKTFVEKWLWEHMRQQKMEIHNKALAKGLIVEDDSIDIAERFFGWDFAKKNEQKFEDEFFTGTPDLFVSIGEQDSIVDIKSSWDEQTFKFFDPAYNRSYFFQLQIYMHLAKRRNASLVYVLTNTPLHLIKKEVINYCYTFGYEVPKDIEETEIYAQFLKRMTFDDLPDEMRIKATHFSYDGNVIDKLVETIKACRTYKSELLNKYFHYFLN